MKIEPTRITGTPFAAAWLERDEAALPFLPADPALMAGYRERAAFLDAGFDAGAREVLAGEFTGGGEGREARLHRFVTEGGYLVTTGQQPGLFGGPLFTLYKGFTAAALARRLEGALGRPVLPVFWIASEHHVWEDLRRARVIDTANELREVALPPRAGASMPVHRVPLEGAGPAAVEQLLALLPDTEFVPRWATLLRESHRPEATLVDAFAHVMEELLGPAGVFLIRANAPALTRGRLPLLLRELEESAGRDRALSEKAAALVEAGFEPQVPHLEGGTNLFLEGPGGRERLFMDGDGFRLRGSGMRLRREDIAARVRDDPSVLSPNVLLRPVVEAALLPTLAYVGGPGEIAYHPQTAPVFEAHGVARPVVHPRAGLFVLERKVEKILSKFEVGLNDLAIPHHELAGRIAREEMPPGVRGAFARAREGVRGGRSELVREVGRVDRSLVGAVESFESQTFGLLEELERKVLQAVKRENEIALRQLAKAQLHLFPLGKPQERVLDPFQFLPRYDAEFLTAAAEAAAGAVLP